MSTGTVVRTLVLASAIINKILEVKGYSPLPIDDEAINEIVTDAYLIGSSIWAWWKNNSFTRAAIAGDEEMKAQRAKTKLYKKG